MEAVDSIGRIEKPAATSVKSPEDLRILIRMEQEKFVMLAPPSLEPYWSVRTDDVFVDWFSGEWGEAATKLAIATLDKNMIPRYEILLWEDPESGIITIHHVTHSNSIS